MTSSTSNGDSAKGDVTFVASITLKNGRKIYAAAYGLKAFPLWRKGKRRKKRQKKQ